MSLFDFTIADKPERKHAGITGQPGKIKWASSASSAQELRH
jgi:hypothetical protein